MKIRSFRGLVPASNSAAGAVLSPPYDCVTAHEARAILAKNPQSFMGVVRPDALVRDGVGQYDAQVYTAGAARLRALEADGLLRAPDARGIYVYELRDGGVAQRGVVALLSVRDYDTGVVKRHELTRPAKEDDRVRLAEAVGAQTGPVFLTYRDVGKVDAIVDGVTKGKPMFDVVGDDDVEHSVWRVPDEMAAAMVDAFGGVDSCYIADGHHRAASSARVARKRAVARGEDVGCEDSESAWFLGVLFPETQLQCLPYNRVVKDLNGHSARDFLTALRGVGEVVRRDAMPSSPPAAKGAVHVYLAKAWYTVDLSAVGSTAAADREDDEVAKNLDCSLLQEKILSPLLGVDDPRTNSRIEFVGGTRGIAALRNMVDDNGDGVAFLLHPVAVADLMSVADAGGLMPPKSTWFVPKLASGLFVQKYS